MAAASMHNTRVVRYAPGMRQVHVNTAIDIQEIITKDAGDAAKFLERLTNVQHGCWAAGKVKM